MRRSLLVVSLLALIAACGGNSSLGPTKQTARPEINSLTANGRTWNNGHRYSIEFNFIERGGVPIVITDNQINADVYEGSRVIDSGYWDASKIFGTNRIQASGNRWAQNLAFDIYPPDHPSNTHATSIKIFINWDDDNQHRGVATATVDIPVFP